jgi:HD-GYP domain-containing protein (c-di-GMP phosphodiesterase class II)
MRLVPIGSIKEGSLLAKSIYDEDGRVLLNNGVDLTESLIEKLKVNKVYAVHIADDYSVGEIKDVIRPELRNLAVKEIKTVFEAIRKEVEKTVHTLKNEQIQMNRRLKLMVDQKYFEGVEQIINEMMGDITHNKDVMIGLVDIKNMQSFVYQHSIQVTILSILIGISMKMNGKMLKDLAIAAMLHDIGLAFIDKELVNYRSDFSEEQKKDYQLHCKLGNDFLKENTMLSVGARMGVLEHHEYNDGSGYPLGLKEEQIHINARIIHVANVYDKMTSGHLGRVVPPNEAIEYIMGNAGNGRIFDFEIANLFVRRIVPFPIGSFVLLSNGEKAVVTGYNADNPLRPIVKIIEKGKKIDELQQLNLISANTLNITVKKIIYEV